MERPNSSSRRTPGGRRAGRPLPLRLSEIILIATIACVSLTVAVQSLVMLVDPPR